MLQLQQNLGVRMLLIQETTENVGTPKPLKISGLPVNVDVSITRCFLNKCAKSTFKMSILEMRKFNEVHIFGENVCLNERKSPTNSAKPFPKALSDKTKKFKLCFLKTSSCS